MFYNFHRIGLALLFCIDWVLYAMKWFFMYCFLSFLPSPTHFHKMKKKSMDFTYISIKHWITSSHAVLLLYFSFKVGMRRFRACQAIGIVYIHSMLVEHGFYLFRPFVPSGKVDDSALSIKWQQTKCMQWKQSQLRATPHLSNGESHEKSVHTALTLCIVFGLSEIDLISCVEGEITRKLEWLKSSMGWFNKWRVPNVRQN